MKPAGMSKPLARRDFLRIGSKVVLIGAAGSLISPKGLFAAAAMPSGAFDPLLSIGYAPKAPDEGSSVRLVSADSILTPDPLFIARGARVTVLGSGRAPSRRNAPGSLYLDVMFPDKSGSTPEGRRFRFWSLSGRDDHDAVSGNVSFRIPVVATTGIPFTARYGRPDLSTPANATSAPAIGEDNASFTLSLGNVAGPKLQTGVYVVALREPGESGGGVWDRLRISNSGGNVVVSDANFTYVILEVGYGDQGAPRHRAVT